MLFGGCKIDAGDGDDIEKIYLRALMINQSEIDHINDP